MCRWLRTWWQNLWGRRSDTVLPSVPVCPPRSPPQPDPSTLLLCAPSLALKFCGGFWPLARVEPEQSDPWLGGLGLTSAAVFPS